MAATQAANAGSKDQTFFAEEASRQILQRVANVLQDPDICDATFVVEEGTEKEEICAPTQFMAMSSPYFKSLFYPPTETQRKAIVGMQPKTFRKILDYLFRGRVPLSSIEDAWKIKVAGKIFQLRELEELCTKFLQYRIDSRNLIHFLKNTSKYNTPDLRDVVISRFLKNADKGFEDEQMLDLTEDEMLNIMSRRPDVQARKVMEVLIKWARKRYNEKKAEEKRVEDKRLEEVRKAEEKRLEEKKAEEKRLEEEKKIEEKKLEEENKSKENKPEDAKSEEKMDVDGEQPKVEETKKDDSKKEEDKKVDSKSEHVKKDNSEKEGDKIDETKKDEKKDETKDGDVKKAGDSKDDAITEEIKIEENVGKKAEEKKDETKKTEEKKEDTKLEEKKIEEKKSEKKPEEQKIEEKEEEINIILALEQLVKYLKWDHTDAPYYLKEIRGKLIMSQECQNEALTQMLQSFVDNRKHIPQQTSPAASKIGPRSAQQPRGSSPHAPSSYTKGQ